MGLKARPVGADQVIEIGGVQRRIGVGRKRLRVEADQPARRLPDGERHNDGHRHQRRQPQTQPRRFPLTRAIRPFLLFQQGYEQPYAANRRKQNGLRLDQHRRRKQRERRPPVPADGRQTGEHHQQRQHAVGLSPCRTVDQHHGVKRIEPGYQGRRRIAQTLAGEGKQQNRSCHIAQDGQALDHQQRDSRTLHGAQQQADGPEQ